LASLNTNQNQTERSTCSEFFSIHWIVAVCHTDDCRDFIARHGRHDIPHVLSDLTSDVSRHAPSIRASVDDLGAMPSKREVVCTFGPLGAVRWRCKIFLCIAPATRRLRRRLSGMLRGDLVESRKTITMLAHRQGQKVHVSACAAGGGRRLITQEIC
jgi:hypothetical protein